ncbi:DUF2442 domain-containing protein [Dyadobacter sp. CY343]|uniref:DUF2442 domain-containing protein n=1 Tax=Dyadobacter sp. CY343 TaxID=2907299 RepID=UPI001F46F24E|nr:DUF2442 domain-containing protein [Dyadobacter sp. CY343]MCE7062857.1 DUF2442 domain-containing protein [Dyadobacter sp. CY343]
MMNPRIKEIVSIDAFVITVLWSDNIVRAIDFGEFLAEYFEKPESVYYQLLQANTFKKAKTDGKTIYWDDLIEIIDYDGKPIAAPLDFDPDVLFNISKPLDSFTSWSP